MVPQFRIIMLLLDLLVDTKRLFLFAIFFATLVSDPTCCGEEGGAVEGVDRTDEVSLGHQISNNLLASS